MLLFNINLIFNMLTDYSISSIIRYAFKNNKLNLFIVFLALFFGASYTVVWTSTIESFAHAIDKNKNDIYIYILIFPLIELCFNLIWRIYEYNYAKISSNSKARIIKFLFTNLLHQNISFFRQQSSGTNINKIMDISRSIEELFDLLTRNFLLKLASVSLAIIKIYSYSHMLAYILISWIIFFFCIMYLMTPQIVYNTNQYAQRKSIVAGVLLDSVLNIHTIKNFFTQKYEQRYLNIYNATMMQAEQQMLNNQNKLKLIIWASYSFMMYFFVYNIYLLLNQNMMHIISIAPILYLVNNIGEDFSEILQDGSDILNEYGILQQSIEIIKKPDIQDQYNAKDIQINQGEIIFSNVSFKYPNNDKYTFKNLSIHIPAKQKIALVGYSGSGKTTFINLINRTFDIDSGQITIDGKNISHITQKSLNREICFVHQDTILFNRTIFENITYGSRNHTLEQVMNAAKKAYIHDVISKMPQQYDSICGERGNALSGGQKQRILIARAILLDKPILIMDEATSALDQITEKYIQDSLFYLMQNKTCIVIAHRLSTIQSLDRILMFDNGKITEDGSHEELLKNNKSYYNMYNSIHQI